MKKKKQTPPFLKEIKLCEKAEKIKKHMHYAR